MGFLYGEGLRGRNTNGMNNESFGNILLSGMMVGYRMKVSISVSLIVIDLMGKGVIKKVENKDIKKRKGMVDFKFHGELDVRGNMIKCERKAWS